MAVTIAKENYPAYDEGNGSGVSGKREVLYVSYGTSGNGWELVGGALNHNFGYSLNVEQTQTKDSGMWSEGVVVGKSATLSAEIMYKTSDLGQMVIEAFVKDDDISNSKRALKMAIVNLDSKEYTEFWCIPDSWEKTAEAEGFITKSLSAVVVGKPVEKTGFTVGA